MNWRAIRPLVAVLALALPVRAADLPRELLGFKLGAALADVQKAAPGEWEKNEAVSRPDAQVYQNFGYPQGGESAAVFNAAGQLIEVTIWFKELDEAKVAAKAKEWNDKLGAPTKERALEKALNEYRTFWEDAATRLMISERSGVFKIRIESKA